MTTKAIERVTKNSNWGWIIIILAATGVRLAMPWFRSFDSIWQDEAWSIMISELPIRDLLHLNLVSDTVTPVYYLLLHVWRIMFGSLEIPLRMLSVFFGLITLPLTFMVVRQRFKTEIAYLATFFVALTPQLVGNSTEIRYYSLLLSLSLWVLYITNAIIDISWQVKFENKFKLFIWIWVLSAFVLLMTHHFGGWVILGCLLYLISSINRNNLPVKSIFHAPSVVGLILSIVWILYFVSQLNFLKINHSSLKAPKLIDLITFWVDTLFVGLSIQKVWLLIGSLLILIIVYWVILSLKATEAFITRHTIILLLSFAFFIPIVTFLIALAFDSPQLLSRRYVPIVSWSVCVLAAFIIENQVSNLPSTARLILKVSITSLMLMGLFAFIQPEGSFSYPDWRGAAAILKTQVRPIDLIVVCEPDNDLAIRYSPSLIYYMPWFGQSWRTGPGGVVKKGPEQLVRGVNINGPGKVIRHVFDSLRNRKGLRTLDNYYQRFISIEALIGDLERMKGNTIVWILIPSGQEVTAYKIAEQLSSKFRLFESKTDFILRRLKIVRMQRIG